MLLDIKCMAIPSIKVTLEFDDRSVKTRVIGIDDLVDILYNHSGLRKHVVGKVVSISANGPDPKGWVIIVDGSDDFSSEMARFSPMSILDCDIIRKAGTIQHVVSPLDDTGVKGIRVDKEGKLLYTKDGSHWHHIYIDSEHVIPVENEEFDDNNDDNVQDDSEI